MNHTINHPATNHTDTIIRDRIKHMQSRVLDEVDRILDRMSTPALPAPPLAVVRRRAANLLGLWKFCDNSRCRRAACCRGEPLQCLHAAMPLLEPEAVAALVPPAAPRKRQPRASAGP
jgi:hypothetical protein